MLTRRRDIALLAAIYAHREAGRYVSFERLISLGIFQAGLSPLAAFLASRALIKRGLIEPGDRDGKCLPTVLTAAGRAWFEAHANYQRTGNRYRYEVVRGPTRFSGPPGRRGKWAKLFNWYLGIEYNLLKR